MAELGRARPIVVAAIGVLLTANISVLSFHRAEDVRRTAVEIARTTTSVVPPPPGRLVFGTRDTLLGKPTVFSVRPDGTDLSPSPRPAKRTDQPLRPVEWGDDAHGVFSHDGAHFAVVGRDVWVIRVSDGKATRLTSNVTPVRPAQPVWSPDDAHVAFVWRSSIVVIDADGSDVHVAYRPSANLQTEEYVSLFGWEEDNMAA